MRNAVEKLPPVVADAIADQSRIALARMAPSDTPAQKLEKQLMHAIEMERRSATRVKRAATIMQKWQRTRRRIERRIGQTEVDRIVNSAAAIEEITQKKNRVQKVVRRLTESK